MRIGPSVCHKELIPFGEYLKSLRTEAGDCDLYILYIPHDDLTIHLHLDDYEHKDTCELCMREIIQKNARSA